MFAVGHLTLTYKNGVNLFSELSLLRDRSPGLQYGRLERQLLVAQQRLPADILRKDHAQTNANGTVPTPTPPDVSAAAPAPAQESGGVGITEEIQRDLIAQDASFQYAHDLTTLDKELRLVKEKSDAFLFAADAQLAVPQMLWNFSARLWVNLREAAVCSLRVLKRIECTTADGKPLSETELKIQSAAITQQYEKQYASVDVSSVQNFCQDLRHIETAQSNDWDLKKAGLTTFPADKLAFIGRSTYLFEDRLGIKTMDLMRQNCRMNLSYYSQSIPNILDIQNKISGRLATYSYLALPALYGALGSLMYFMRRILDPLLPNPPLLRMIYRVALGALAGMVLAWFWDGTFNNNEAFQTIGFGLFSLAFVFGFAIDVFFTLLDRFVNISTNAVSKIGTTG
ncbi:hypothetical protein EOA85_14665 [Mesorhizobium sp. M5C.F.Ca.IN.020.29.1.1]|nr:hypothetical protein EOA85_14665 [Mesorhizobium sp. M5C.F.Ca.IN.020.29.1.1]